MRRKKKQYINLWTRKLYLIIFALKLHLLNGWEINITNKQKNIKEDEHRRKCIIIGFDL